MGNYIKVFRHREKQKISVTRNCKRHNVFGKNGVSMENVTWRFSFMEISILLFFTWKKNGILETIHQCLVEKVRESSGKKSEPTVGIIDAQSVKNTLVSAENKGFDAGKKIKGIKRHIIVDTLGLILAVVIQNASMQDRDGAQSVIRQMKENWIRVIKIFADGGYAGKLIIIIKQAFNIELEIIKRSE